MSRKKKRERRKREKMPFIVATYVYASSQGQRTHSARTNFIFKVTTMKSKHLIYSIQMIYIIRHNNIDK